MVARSGVIVPDGLWLVVWGCDRQFPLIIGIGF